MKELSAETMAFVDGLIEKGLVCKWATGIIADGYDHEKLWRIACEPDNMGTLFRMRKNGIEVPFDALRADFADYINGGVIPSYGIDGTSYYAVGQREPLTVMNTNYTLVDCRCDIVCWVVNRFKLVMDESSSIRLMVKPDTNVTIETFGRPEIEIVGEPMKVRWLRR